MKIYLCRFASSVGMEVAYGQESSAPDNQYMRNIRRVSEMAIEVGTQGSNPVDAFPICEFDSTNRWLRVQITRATHSDETPCVVSWSLVHTLREQ